MGEWALPARVHAGGIGFSVLQFWALNSSVSRHQAHERMVKIACCWQLVPLGLSVPVWPLFVVEVRYGSQHQATFGGKG